MHNIDLFATFASSGDNVCNFLYALYTNTLSERLLLKGDNNGLNRVVFSACVHIPFKAIRAILIFRLQISECVYAETGSYNNTPIWNW